VPRRRRWWIAVPGLGQASAKRVEAFFAAHPDLTERARALVTPVQVAEIAPWETLVVPRDLDGSRGQFRASRATCALSASNDYEAVRAWIERHEAEATQRAYKKEAERLILWSVVQRGKALSSLTAEDATAYRAFLRNPIPKARWVGPAQARTSPGWRPFVGPLAGTSVKYSVSVLGALFRWLVEQHYVVANPFAGLKVRGGTASSPADAGRVFTQAEWRLIRVVADGLEWSYGWSNDAAYRLRFILDFGRGTGLRPSELCDATLGDICIEELNDCWIDVVGKGAKKAKVSVPPLVRAALNRYLTHRGLATSPNLWHPDTRLVAKLSGEVGGGITPARLLDILERFFETAAKVVSETSPVLAEKLRSATTHWMRHTHATHALELGVPLLAVRDNLRHASVATTSNYLHSDASKRAAELSKAFGEPAA
jgi:site-specific recombinase XerD